VDVRIGLTYTSKEVDLQLADDTDREALQADITDAIKVGRTIWLTDRKGRTVGIAAEKVAYVELGSPSDDRRIGFGS
jgi:hypothetical protein